MHEIDLMSEDYELNALCCDASVNFDEISALVCDDFIAILICVGVGCLMCQKKS